MENCVQRMMRGPIAIGVMLCLVLGCQSMYYAGMEKLGYPKRDLLVSEVQEARVAQKEAKAQFQSALDEFSSVVNFQGGELQEKYEKLNSQYQESVVKAKAVQERIDSVEDVSQALFTEWEDELKEYSNPSLRRSSKRKLKQTQNEYDHFITAMKKAEKKMDPVLAAFKDQVLFLKHNLNAQAIASLKGELGGMEDDISALIKDMELSIAEADSFLEAMGKGEE